MRHILIVACVLSIFSSFSQQTVALETQLTLKENKFYSNGKPFTGQLITLFENGQQKSIVEVKDGVPNGKTIEYLFDKHFQKKNYQDSVEIKKFNKLISEKKAEIELNIQDTIKASKEEKDFLNYEIGGFDKLAKLNEKNDEGKLNKKKKEEFDKYEVLVQEKNKALRKLKDAQQALNELNLNLKGETSKSIYFPKKAKEYEQINSIKEGKAIVYDSLGNKFGEGNYSNGKQNGEWVYYYSNGKIQGKGKFINGNETEIGRSGVPRNGREGVWIFYSENGIKESEGNYNFGLLNGNYISYFNNGKINSIESFVNNKKEGFRKIYYENGNLREEGNYSNGKENGLFVFYSIDGIKSSESNFVNGERLGKELLYYEDGKVKAEYTVATSDVKNGIEKVYHKNGKLKEERNYKMGKRQGKVKTYYESGKIESDGNFENDKLHGAITTYFENGKVKYKATFDTTSLAKNNLIGDVYEYNEDGSIKLHAYAYKDGRIEDKITSNSGASGTANSELKKPYKCKCCKSTINGLQEGVDKDGGEYNDFLRQLLEESKIFTTFGYQNVYEYLRVDTYKFCTMKCARTCYESIPRNHNSPLPIGGY